MQTEENAPGTATPPRRIAPSGSAVRCPVCGGKMHVVGHVPGAAQVLDTRSVIAFFLGCASIILGPIPGIIAVLIGVIAIHRVGRNRKFFRGLWMAAAGIALGIVFTWMWWARLFPWNW